VPFLKQVLSDNNNSKSQIDLIMLLTPHVVRTSEVTEADLRPIYIGSTQNLGVGGPPPLIAVPDVTPAPAPNQAAPAPGPGAAPGGQTPPATFPTTTPGVGVAQVLITPPGTTFRVGQGPYTVPLSIVNAARLVTLTLTVTYDPSLLRVRTVQEGSFMRSGGAS